MERKAFEATVIWFLRNQALWQAPLYGHGDTLRLGPPSRQAHTPYKSGRWLTVTASSSGHWITVDDGTSYDPERSGGLWLVETHPKGNLRKLPHTASPSFSPDSRHLAVTRIESTGKKSVAILDLVTSRWRTLLTDASQPFWSADGRELALIKAGTGVEFGMVVDAQSGQVRYKTDAVVSLAYPLLSPDGRYFADLCAISRPKLGHSLHDRRTKQTIKHSLDWLNRLPAKLYGWSPNGKWLACNWFVSFSLS